MRTTTPVASMLALIVTVHAHGSQTVATESDPLWSVTRQLDRMLALSGAKESERVAVVEAMLGAGVCWWRVGIEDCNGMPLALRFDAKLPDWHPDCQDCTNPWVRVRLAGGGACGWTWARYADPDLGGSLIFGNCEFGPLPLTPRGARRECAIATAPALMADLSCVCGDMTQALCNNAAPIP